MKLETLHDCLALKAMCLYDVETQILKALPKMIKNSTSEKLKEAFTEHMSETENHVQRIEQIFEAWIQRAIVLAVQLQTRIELLRKRMLDAEDGVIRMLRGIETIDAVFYLQLIDALRLIEPAPARAQSRG